VRHFRSDTKNFHWPGPVVRWSIDRRVLSRVTPSAELFHDLSTKRRQVGRATACHEPVVHDDFLIDPGGAGILQVGLERRPRSDGSPADDIGLDQGPGGMANRRYEKLADKGNHLRIQAQGVRIGYAAGQDETCILMDTTSSIV
jgi:hypothetical protein